MAAIPDEIPPPGRRAVAAMLRKISQRARSIDTSFGSNPEKKLASKDEVAAAIDRVAAILEGGAA